MRKRDRSKEIVYRIEKSDVVYSLVHRCRATHISTFFAKENRELLAGPATVHHLAVVIFFVGVVDDIEFGGQSLERSRGIELVLDVVVERVAPIFLAVVAKCVTRSRIQETEETVGFYGIE